MRIASEIKRLARGHGVSPSEIYIEPYGAPNAYRAPVKVSFTQTVAKPPECGKWPENVGRNDRNDTYHNFGCAQQKNIAAMVANPRDLLGPRPLDPRPSERGAVQWEKFIQGEPTGATRSEEEKKGNISEVAE